MDARFRVLAGRQRIDAWRAFSQRGHGDCALRAVLVPAHFHVSAGSHPAGGTAALRPKGRSLRAASGPGRLADRSVPRAAPGRLHSGAHRTLRAERALHRRADRLVWISQDSASFAAGFFHRYRPVDIDPNEGLQMKQKTLLIGSAALLVLAFAGGAFLYNAEKSEEAARAAERNRSHLVRMH